MTAIADRGKAKQAIAELLARTFDVSVSQLEITRGHSGRLKTVDFSSPPTDLQEQVQKLMQSS